MATNTYVALSTYTIPSAVASYTFTSIPQGYTDLVLVSNPKVSTNQEAVQVQFNTDTSSGSTNYSFTQLYGDGSSAASSRSSNGSSIYLSNGTSASNYGAGIFNIMNYSNTTTYKTVLGRFSEAAYVSWADVGLWRNTAAITSLTLTVSGTSKTLSAGSTFSLYGIAAAVIPTAKATGGTITYAADGYTYHTFLSSGTFTPTQALTCDTLVIAGGGGGSGNGGGGGGAGGVCYQTGRSVTATGKTVTVGAGGTYSPYSGAVGSNSVFDTITALGGGNGGTAATVGANGGSGGGTGRNAGTTVGTATQGSSGGATGYGFNGGQGENISRGSGGGGGGAGGVGQNYTGTGTASTGVGGIGGVGLNTWSDFAAATSTGVSGFYAGGGGGGGNGSGGTATAGGGAGIGPSGTSNAGTANTGGGGGGAGEAGGGNGAAGGSGIVIIRYAS